MAILHMCDDLNARPPPKICSLAHSIIHAYIHVAVLRVIHVHTHARKKAQGHIRIVVRARDPPRSSYYISPLRMHPVPVVFNRGLSFLLVRDRQTYTLFFTCVFTIGIEVFGEFS